jgi:DNA-binding transcriptional LysR family regulator
MLKNGEIDFGIVSFPIANKDFNFTKLMEIHDIFVAKEGYTSEKEAKIQVSALSKYPLMLLEPENITRQYINNFFLENNVIIEPEIEIGNMDFLIEFAKIGLGISAVIKEFVQKELKEGLLKEIAIIPSAKTRSIGIVTHKSMPISISSKTFIAYLMENVLREV